MSATERHGKTSDTSQKTTGQQRTLHRVLRRERSDDSGPREVGIYLHKRDYELDARSLIRKVFLQYFGAGGGRAVLGPRCFWPEAVAKAL